MNRYWAVLLGTGITFGATALGAATVFFTKKVNEKFYKACMGFASGIMMAAAVWSLILPAIEMSGDGKVNALVPVIVGLVVGGLFLFLIDKLLPHQHADETSPEGLKANFRKSTMLMTSVTIHNIPEGMAVGLAFSLAYTDGSPMSFMGAMTLCIGMALQNFPEGAAISLPLRQQGMSRPKAFLFGALSGIVEPIGGFLIVLLAGALIPALPYMLCFAAGAMIYVVVEELIPDASGGHSNIGVLSFMAGFIVMMVLDIALS